MEIAESRRVQLEVILEGLRHAKTPVDNLRIDQVLIALIETVLEPGAPGDEAQSPTGAHGA
jgi:hypothetical protein